MGRLFLPLLLTAIPLAVPQAAHAQAFFSRTAFLGALGGTPTVTIDFDGIVAGTDLTGSAIGELQLDRLDVGCPGVSYGASLYRCGTQTSAALIVVAGSPALPATSAPNLLSPGGANVSTCNHPATENDDLKLTFATPVSALGIDIVFKSADGFSAVGVRFLDASNAILHETPFIPSPFVGLGVPGSQFVGFVSSSSSIKSVEIDEFDENCINPDEHVGYDSLVYVRGGIAELGDLIALVQSFGLTPTGIETSLVAKLSAALAALVADNSGTTCNNLTAFLNQVSAQSGKHLTTAQAAALTAAATALKTLLGCP